MKAALAKLWQSRAPRERVALAIVAALVTAALYLVLIQSADRARAQLGKSVSQLRSDAVRLERSAEEIARLRQVQITRPQAAPETDLRAQVQARIDAAGLASALLRIEPVDAGQVRVVFGSVPFAEWITWVDDIQSGHIRLDSARIEALSVPGLVSVTATYVRPRP